MKIHRFAAFPLTCAALALGSSSLLQAQRFPAPNSPIWEQPTQSSTRGRVHRINPKAETYTMVRMAGRPVRSKSGEQLSTITDFLVEPKSGRVRFAILPSGGGPKGMTYRIIPISAFTGANEDALILRLDRAHWDRVGTMEESQLKDRVTIDLDHQERLGRQLGLPASEIYDGRGPAQLVRATALRGQSIRSGNGLLGRIEDVVVDVTRRESAIVFSTDRSFADSEQRFVVSFELLGTNVSGSWASRLNRDDFQGPDQTPPPSDDGRRNYQNSPSREQSIDVRSASLAVRQSIDRSWAHGRVDVVTEGSHLVLQGLLDNEQDRAEIERMAERTVPGVRIENQIAVRKR